MKRCENSFNESHRLPGQGSSGAMASVIGEDGGCEYPRQNRDCGAKKKKIEIWPRKLIMFGQNIGNEGNRGR